MADAQLKITVISQFYNDSLLSPLFFRHYGYADEIHILLETDTNDNTREICARYPNVVVEDVHCPGGHDDRCKTDNTNRAASKITEGWITPADSDEFVFPEGHEDPRKFLARQTADVVMAKYWYVYRHVTDKDIDYNADPIPQRVHGWDPFTKVGAYRAGKGIEMTIGNHEFLGVTSSSVERYVGAHWNMADVEISKRRLVSRDRMSPMNKKKRYGWHNFRVTEEDIAKRLQARRECPVINELVSRKENEWLSWIE